MRDDILMSARHPLEYARHPVEFGPGLEGEALVALLDRQEQALRDDAAQFEHEFAWALCLAAIVGGLLWALGISVLRWALT